MRENLKNYVKLLFAGAPDAEDIQQEILQNTLDRFDDLVDQGKSPQAAYSLAIAGIGDISEILGKPAASPAPIRPVPQPESSQPKSRPLWKRIGLAVAIFLYIIAIIPLIVLSELGMDVIGLCGTLSIVAVATVALIVSGGGAKKAEKEEEGSEVDTTRRAVKKAINTLGLAAYFLVSFTTGAWYITWLIFPMMSAANGIAFAILDLKEGT